MRFVSDGHRLGSLLVDLTNRHKKFAFASAWASSGTKFLKAINKNKEKIKHGVIGTHFYQTHPDVLDMFVGFQNVHFILQPSGVFHPKTYYFWTKSDWDLVIGSANMTNGAFGANQELSLHVSSGDINTDGLLGKEVREIIKNMWAQGSVMDEQTAAAYRKIHSIQKPRANKLSAIYHNQSGKKGKTGKSPLKSEIMTMTWDDYFARIQADDKHNVDSRCFMLESASREFRTHSFKLMDIDWRKAIAGVHHQDYRFLGHGWGWFGSMVGAEKFKNRININNIHLSNALDFINLDGAVSYQDYLNYVEEFRMAFPDGGDGVGLASRLLAFKRPDYFVCLNKKNRKTLCEEFEIRNIYASDYERYWTELIDRIVDSIWWNSPQPRTPLEKRVWQGRAAMPDAIFYDPGA